MGISNYSMYIKELEKVYRQYGYHAPDAVLRDFISREHLDKNFGINISDIRKDLSAIHSQWSAYLRGLEQLYNRYGRNVPDAELNSYIVRERLDKKYGLGLSDLRKDLYSIYERRYNVQKVTRSANVVKQPEAQVTPDASLKSYPEYMAALEKQYINNGKVILNDLEIQRFINTNKLDTAFGITISDVKKDLQTIDKKWHPAPRVAISRPMSQVVNQTQKAKLTTYKQYMDALNRLYLANGTALDDNQIQKFISDNAIDIAFGITIADVRKDIQTIESGKTSAQKATITNFEEYEKALAQYASKYGDKSFLDINLKKFISEHMIKSGSEKLVADIRMDLIYIQSKMPLVSETANSFKKQTSAKEKTEHLVDEKFREDVANILRKHKNVITHLPAIRGLLWDYFPSRKREINVLMIFVQYGILQAIIDEATIDSIFVSKYVSRAINEYGIEREFATEMAMVWCYSYGESILGKRMVF